MTQKKELSPEQSELLCRAMAVKHGLEAPDLGGDRSLHEMGFEELFARKNAAGAFTNALLEKGKASESSYGDDERAAVEYVIERAERIAKEIRARTQSGKHGPRSTALFGGGGDDAREDSGWRTAEGTPVPVLKAGERLADCAAAGGRGVEYGAAGEGLRFPQMLRAMVLGPRSEAERRALSEGTDSTGGFTVNPRLSAQVIDRLRAKSRVIQAGALTVPLTTMTEKIARLASDPTASWHTENSQESDNTPTFEQVTFTARTMISIVRASREMLEDSVNAEEALMNAFAMAMSTELDRAALYGTGVAPQPSGLSVVSGVGQVLVTTTLANYDPLLDGVQKILEANAGMPSAGILHPRIAVVLSKLKDTTNQPMQKPDMIAKLPLLETTQVNLDEGGSPAATSIFLGDWSEMMIGVRAALRVEVLRERYADFHQYGFVAHLRADIQLKHPGAFCRVMAVEY